jgi:hypothetical protein
LAAVWPSKAKLAPSVDRKMTKPVSLLEASDQFRVIALVVTPVKVKFVGAFGVADVNAHSRPSLGFVFRLVTSDVLPKEGHDPHGGAGETNGRGTTVDSRAILMIPELDLARAFV